MYSRATLNEGRSLCMTKKRLQTAQKTACSPQNAHHFCCTPVGKNIILLFLYFQKLSPVFMNYRYLCLEGSETENLYGYRVVSIYKRFDKEPYLFSFYTD